MLRTSTAHRIAMQAAQALVLMLAAAHAAVAAPNGEPVIHQLRIYDIVDDNRQAFHARFRDHAARIMARYDFNILAMWESRTAERTEFVYLLEWPDEQTMKDRWTRFMADQEWSDIKRKTGDIHGRFVNNIEERTLILTDYSPALSAPTGDAVLRADDR